MDNIVIINSLNHEGAGVGRLKNGMVVFVPGALPGERVSVELVNIKKNYAVARLLRIEEASPERVLPPCPEANSCGGCQRQHLNYHSQLYWKRQFVVDALQRLGGIAVNVRPVLGMQNPWGYRNKVRLHCDKGRLGFYRPGSHELTPLGRCPLLPPAMLDLARMIERLLPTVAPGLKHLTLRQGWATGELLVVLETAAGWRSGKALAQQLADYFPDIVSIVHKPEKRKEIVLYGRDYLEERLGTLRFHISSNTFFQVNSVQAELLYEQTAACAGLRGEEEVLDAYCGSGAIALWLSRQAGQVCGVEVMPQAIKDAWRNAALNKITNANFLAGDAA
ncbi:MAG: 23S rRNA (uracil(1939)-C(5))-methyltransferase RlmD, partial [Clostridia bacterium]|nr:23S rRNA (uracil(1939)-C(5))-methyltransferase RlmD [Clostridia bacterium]